MLDMRNIYREAFFIRRFEIALAEEYAEQNIRMPVHFSIGQEIIPVCVLATIKEQGFTPTVYASHRAHAAYLATGGDPAKLMAELRGDVENGATNGYGGSMYLYDRLAGFRGSFAIVGDAISVATGYAFALQQMSIDDVMPVVFLGDAVAETGQFWEAINFATLHRLRILYVIENNRYATQTHIDQRQPDPLVSARLEGWRDHMYVQHTKDRDAHNVLKATYQALKSSHPTKLIEVMTYRYLEHVGPNRDDELGYRTSEERAWWEDHDPIDKLSKDLTTEGEHNLKPVWVDVNTRITSLFSRQE
jgi:TPP-dependent pyruvate/acetoin dehydrogenase alpha subunit